MSESHPAGTRSVHPTTTPPATPHDYRHLRYEYQDGAAWITFAEPETGNALHPGSLDELFGAVRRAHDDAARVIVLGAEGRFFCVGGDLATFAAAPEMGHFVDDLADRLHRLISELVRSPAVVVAAVQGAAAGAGLSLVAAADVVISADQASFTLAYSAVGLSNDGGSSMLVHSIGLHRLMRMALLNDRLTAQEAYDAGLVARVVAPSELANATHGVVAALTSGPPTALANCKNLIRTTAESSPESVMRREALAIRHSARLNGQEGVTAFLQKRTPHYTEPTITTTAVEGRSAP